MSAGQRFPDFLIVGAMKSGTTSLYRDLLTHPRVFFPIDKEPHNLARDRTLTPEGREEYAAMFRGARDDQLCGEASTGYTKIPMLTGCAERAKELCGPELKAIYLVREPVSRIVSQHHHEWVEGKAPASIEKAVREHGRFIDFSRYAMQIRPWIDVFGVENVRVVQFERYTKDRSKITGELEAFLGLEPMPERVQTEKVFNRSDNKPVVKGFWRGVQGNPVYQRVIRPMLSAGVKERLRSAVLPKAPPRPDPPSPETVEWMLERLRDDAAELASITGVDGPIWDESRVRAKYAVSASSGAA